MSHEPYPTDRPAVITCGLPYANGDLHIGHMRTYVSGDVMARAMELIGQDRAFVCGSDMHGTPVAVNAEKEGISPEEFAMRWHEKYQETFPKFAIEFDNYGHTHDETNMELTREFVLSWIDGGYIVDREIQVAWDPEVDQPLPDRYVEGTCPYCGATARGDECDDGCQRHLEPGEIVDPRSTLTGNQAEYRTRTHKFLQLSAFQSVLKQFLDQLEGTSNAKNQPREWIEGDLQDLCITRDMEWGIDYPGEDGEDLVLYVWVDAPIEYVSSTKQYSERVGSNTYDWEEAWKDDGEIIHIIGRDIIQHHCVFWPAMLEGAGYHLPRAVMASGFVNLEGRAFSTSRNRAIWVDDYLAADFHPDLLRYYLITAGGFQQDIDFSWDKFQEVVNAELVGAFGNFVYRSMLFAHRTFDGTPDGSLSDSVRDEIERAMAAIPSAINAYSLRDVGTASMALARFGNEYIQQNEPWKLIDDDPDAAAQVMFDCVQLVKAIAFVARPVMPVLADEIWTQLGEEGSVHDQPLEAAIETPPATFGEPSELVERIPDERVEELNVALSERIKEASESADTTETSDPTEEPEFEPIDETRVPFERFTDLDLRVGVIESVEPIADADDLVILKVDIGVETRQIVAGIKRLHDIETLPGKRVIVVANLEPATLFGVESNGMILAAGEHADLLTTHGDSDPGMRIR